MLLLSASARLDLERRVREGYPCETCGVLIGRSRSGRSQVLYGAPARNLEIERARERFELDPGDLVAADAAARERGLAIVGSWHSHPDHPAAPSEADRAAAWPGWSCLILSVDPDGVGDVRSWRLVAGRLREEEVVVRGRPANDGASRVALLRPVRDPLGLSSESDGRDPESWRSRRRQRPSAPGP